MLGYNGGYTENTNNSTRFEELESRIIEALQARHRIPGVNEQLIVVGLSSIPIQDDLKSVNIGGRNVPVVVVIGQESGRVYHFALKAVLPDWEG